MKKRIFAVAAALCLLAGTGAFAQDSKKAAMMKERPTAEQMAQRRTERMTEKLNLSEKQSKQLYEVNLQDIKEMQAQAEQPKGYADAALDAIATQARGWAQGGDAFVFFINGAKERAPAAAVALIERLGGLPPAALALNPGGTEPCKDDTC